MPSKPIVPELPPHLTVRSPEDVVRVSKALVHEILGALWLDESVFETGARPPSIVEKMPVLEALTDADGALGREVAAGGHTRLTQMLDEVEPWLREKVKIDRRRQAIVLGILGALRAWASQSNTSV